MDRTLSKCAQSSPLNYTFLFHSNVIYFSAWNLKCSLAQLDVHRSVNSNIAEV